MSENDFTIATDVHFEDFDELKEKNQTFLLGKTGFHFLDDHFGLRPENVHVLLSGTSSGKSSLIKTLLTRISQTNRVIWYASEETLKGWKLKFPENYRPKIENLKFIDESELRPLVKNKTIADPFKFLEMQIESFGAKILIFDNLTTSTFYNDKKPDIQSDILAFLKDLTVRQKIATILIAHLSSSNDDMKMFKSSDVRGNRSLSNIAEYWYNLHRLRLPREELENDDSTMSILHVEKSRWHKNSDTSYQLKFSKSADIFIEDRPISWAVTKELFHKSVTVGRKK